MSLEHTSLVQQIETRSKEIKTDGYPMSIGEVLSLYHDGDIDIHPEFQRIFRWNNSQKSSLIESILLGIPIPPIFVSQRDDGVWDVIDGVQRLSTIFEFAGVYKNDLGGIYPPLALEKTEYLPALDGYTFEVLTAGGKTFTDAMRRDFKRAKLEFRIIRKESDENAKYDLFQRLNSGTQLSQQETRNCLLVMLNQAMYAEVDRLSEDVDFMATVPLTEQKASEAYRQELVLRFFFQATYSGTETNLKEDQSTLLTRWMRDAAAVYGTPDTVIDTVLFHRTFRLLNRQLNEDAFRRFDGKRNLGPFSIACFEFVTSGIAANIDLWEANESLLREKVNSIWSAPDFRNNSGTAVNARARVPRMIIKSRRYFAAA